MCYTIYLYHYFVISAFGRLTLHARLTDSYYLNYLIQFILLGGMTLIVCSILFVLFEKPFMYREWPQSLWNLVRRSCKMFKEASSS